MKKLYFDLIDSTNNEAKRIIKREVEVDFWVLADTQNAGRGRFNKSYFSPAGGLYLSVCLKLSYVPNNSFITQAAAVAVCESIAELYGVMLQIKPINDIIYKGKKVGGILVETTARYSDAECFVIFGIGLNLQKPTGGFPPELKNIAGHIFEHKIDRELLSEKITHTLLDYSKNFNSNEILNKYRKRYTAHEVRN